MSLLVAIVVVLRLVCRRPMLDVVGLSVGTLHKTSAICDQFGGHLPVILTLGLCHVCLGFWTPIASTIVRRWSMMLVVQLPQYLHVVPGCVFACVFQMVVNRPIIIWSHPIRDWSRATSTTSGSTGTLFGFLPSSTARVLDTSRDQTLGPVPMSVKCLLSSFRNSWRHSSLLWCLHFQK